MVAHRLRLSPPRMETMTGQGYSGPGPEETPRADSYIIYINSSVQFAPFGVTTRKGGECCGEVSCASLKSVPLRTLRPLVLTGRYERCRPSALAFTCSAGGESPATADRPAVALGISGSREV